MLKKKKDYHPDVSYGKNGVLLINLGTPKSTEVKEIRKKLIYDKKIFTGSSGNKNLLRILPPLTIKKRHIDIFFKSLKEVI